MLSKGKRRKRASTDHHALTMLYSKSKEEESGPESSYLISTFEEKINHPVLQTIPNRSKVPFCLRPFGKKDALLLASTIKSVRENDRTLRTFRVSCESLQDAWLANLADALKTNAYLERIRFNGNEIKDGGVDAMARALEENSSVTELDLGGNLISDYGSQALAEMLHKNKTLLCLNISGRAFRDSDPDAGARITVLGASALASCLKENSTLTSISLANQRIGDTGAEVLASSICKNCGLREIILTENQIGNSGAKAMGNALEENQTLRTLVLRSNIIEDEGSASLATSLGRNKTLTALDLSENTIGDKGIQHLYDMLCQSSKVNPSLKYLSLYGNPAQDSLKEEVESMLDQSTKIKIDGFNLLQTHGNFHKFRDSGETIQCLREYPTDSRTPYAYPLLTMLKYQLPAPKKEKGDPPVSVVTRANGQINQRMEREEIGKTIRYQKWKKSLTQAHHSITKTETWPIKEFWNYYSIRLDEKYPLGIDRCKGTKNYPRNCHPS